MTALSSEPKTVRAPAGNMMPAIALRAASFVLLLAIWEIAAEATGSRTLPSAGTVAGAVISAARRGDLFYQLGITLARSGAAFAMAMAVGTALGLAMGRWRTLDLIFDGWVVLLLNLPALVVAVLAYVWFGLTEVAAIGAVAVNKLPLVAVTLREGVRSLDRDFAEMAVVYRFGPWKRFRHVIAPQLMPFFMVAARSGLSLIWKIVLVVELLGRSNGIGFKLQLYFQLFDVPDILAYALAFAGVVQLIEWGILRPIERRAGSWRR